MTFSASTSLRTEPENSVFSAESSEFVPHLFDNSKDSDGPAVSPLFSEMNYEDNVVDGVNTDSSVRRRVLGKIRLFKAALSVCDPNKFSAEAAQAREVQWLAQVDKKFEELITALSEIENEEGVSVGESEDAEKLSVFMTSIYSEFTAAVAEKCQLARAPVPAAQPQGAAVGGGGVLPPAGLAPGLQLPAQADDFQVRKAQASVEIESEDIRAKVKALAEEFNKVNCWSNAEHHVVETAMGQTKSWRSKLEKLKDNVKEVKKDTRVYNRDTVPLTLATAALNSAEGELDYVIDQIEHEDQARGLYSQSQTKAANIAFPIFSGQDGEDFVKFKKDMENALRVNKVMREDQAKKLRENLRSDALKLVPATIESIDEAMEVLQTVYGDARRILNNRRDKLKNMGVFYKLEKYGGNGSRSASEAKAMVDWLITFELIMKDLFDLSTKGVDLYSSVFNEDLYNNVIQLFPARIVDEVNDVSGTYKDKLEYIFNLAVEKKKTLIPSLAQSASSVSAPSASGTQPTDGRSSRKYGAGVTHNRGGEGGAGARGGSACPLSSIMFTAFKYPQRLDECRVCSVLDKEGVTGELYEEHLTDNPVGCPLFAKMSLADKARYIAQARMCWSCLDGEYIHKPGQRHTDCVADRDKKWYFTCNNSKCRKMFLVCPDHAEANAEKLAKTVKWWESKGKAFSYTVSMSSVFSTSAAASNFQTDDEVTRRMRDTAPPGLPIVAPPPGEPVFMFSYARGKTRPLLVFYDPGASHAMFKEGVPGGELDAVKIRKGPIAISAAGDSQIKANDEWAVVMERYDGKRQTIIGVAADNLTSKFPLISTAGAQKEIVDYAKKNLNRNISERISKLKVPPKVGGSPDVLLGIKYQSCHPEVVFQMPSGLFIARLRLASHDNKTTAVIGGPHSSFDAFLHRCDGDTGNVYSVFTSSLERWRKCGPPRIAGPIMTQEDTELAEISNKADLQMLVGPEGPEEVGDDKPSPELETDTETEILLTDGFTLQCSENDEDVIEDITELVDDIKEQVGLKRVTTVAAVLNEPDEKLNDLKLVITCVVIAISWITRENKRMSIFHRNRVNQFLRHTDTNSHILKPALELRLTNENEYENEFAFERELDILVTGHTVSYAASYITMHFKKVEKMKERAEFSNYIFVLRGSVSKVVTIIILIFKYVNKLQVKAGFIKSNITKKLPSSTALWANECTVESESVGPSWEREGVGQGNADQGNNTVKVVLEEDDVQRAMYQKASAEVKHFVKKETIENIAVDQEGLLFNRSRILDVQAAEFSVDSVDNEIALNLLNLIIRFSHISLSIAYYIHHEVAWHAGFESKSVQECFEKIKLKHNKLHASGYSYSFGPDTNNTPMHKLITPNMCGIGRLNSRNISGPIKIPKEVVIEVEKLYDAFFKIWRIAMITILIPLENELYSQWTVGQGAYFVRDLDLVAQLIKQMSEQEGEEDRRVQPLRVVKDASGNNRVNNASLNNSSGHCSMMSHDIGSRVHTVSCAMFERSQEITEQSDHFPYAKEKISLEDCHIIPTDEDGPEDEFLSMFTALETDFTLA